MRSGVIAFVAGLAAFAVFVAIPFLTKERDMPASITSPPPLAALDLDVIRPGDRLCMNGLAGEQHSQVARFTVGTYGKPGPALRVDISGPGYRTTARVAGGYADNSVQQLRIKPPPRGLLLRACIRNEGRTKAALYASVREDRSRVAVAIDGKPVQGTPTFGFWEAKPKSIAQRAGVTAERITFFRGPLGHTWVVWLLALLTLVALTLGLGAALSAGAPREEPRAPDRDSPPAHR